MKTDLLRLIVDIVTSFAIVSFFVFIVVVGCWRISLYDIYNERRIYTRHPACIWHTRGTEIKHFKEREITSNNRLWTLYGPKVNMDFGLENSNYSYTPVTAWTHFLRYMYKLYDIHMPFGVEQWATTKPKQQQQQPHTFSFTSCIDAIERPFTIPATFLYICAWVYTLDI